MADRCGSLGRDGAEQAGPYPAREADDHLQEVVITGSRIARPDLDRLQPTLPSVPAETFDERGYTDVGQALSESAGVRNPTVQRGEHTVRIRYSPEFR